MDARTKRRAGLGVLALGLGGLGVAGEGRFLARVAEDPEVDRRAAAAAMLMTGVGELMAEHLLLPLPAVAHVINRGVPPSGFVGSRASLPRVSTPFGHALLRYVAFGPDASPAQVAC